MPELTQRVFPVDVQQRLHLPRLIALDGLTASGKSTVGFRLAQELDYLFFDTGILYRIVCWKALLDGSPPFASDHLAEVADCLEFELRAPEPAAQATGVTTTVLVGNRDVTWELRKKEIDQLLPEVAAHSRVRSSLTARMRRIALVYLDGKGHKQGVIMVGRDIGTVVFPDAECKYFLTADPKVRAKRRHAELQVRGEDLSEKKVLADLETRDRVDSTRTLAPAQPADSAIILDTTDWSLDQAVDQVRQQLRDRFLTP